MERKTKLFVIRTVFAIILSLIATQITYLASRYIHKRFTVLPVVRDLIWMKLPYIPKSIIFSEIFVVLSFVVLLFYSLKKDLNYVPYAIFLISIFHILRAGMIVLTPLGFPQDYQGFLKAGKESELMIGAFPSGHLSVPYLLYLLTKSKILLIFTFLVGFFLLISHGHYSIDLIGTLLIAYPVFMFSEKYIRRFFHD